MPSYANRQEWSCVYSQNTKNETTASVLAECGKYCLNIIDAYGEWAEIYSPATENENKLITSVGNKLKF